MMEMSKKKAKAREDHSTSKGARGDSNGEKHRESQKPKINAIKGLTNLGNTCFFNAVVQVLSQTPQLIESLNNTTREETSVVISPDASSDLEPIEAHLSHPGPMTSATCQLLNEIQQSKKQVLTPQQLFEQISKTAAMFRGFGQHDSHELLRCLMDNMRTEEMKRISSGIQEALKSRKSTDEVQSQKVLKEYEKIGVDKNFVVQVFGGETENTIKCQQCKTVSKVKEMFLDLSLPVQDVVYRKKHQGKGDQVCNEPGRDAPVLTNGNDDMPTGSMSKYQQKKTKKKAKKQAKKHREQKKQEGKILLEEAPSKDHGMAVNGNHEEASVNEENSLETTMPDEEQEQCDMDQAKGEQECKQDAVIDLTEDQDPNNKQDAVIDLTEDQDPNNKQDAVNDLAEDQDPNNTVPIDGEQCNEEDEDSLADGISHMCLNTGEDPDSTEQKVKDGEAPVEAKGNTVDQDDAFQSLVTRTAPEKQGCSVQSCLFQFTKLEELAQSSSLLCTTCTKHQDNPKTSEECEKNVYTDALKQTLISSPPAVLTLHLKRFHQINKGISKVNTHVKIPQILDLAPYCSVNCQNVPDGDAQVLYSLYGIIEHSGNMRSGHYVAYVKARPPCQTLISDGMATQGHEEAETESWFCISDTSVKPVTVSQLSDAQAYLLFFERVSK